MYSMYKSKHHFMTIMGLLKDEFTQTKTFCSFPLAHMMIKVVFLRPKKHHWKQTKLTCNILRVYYDALKLAAAVTISSYNLCNNRLFRVFFTFVFSLRAPGVEWKRCVENWWCSWVLIEAPNASTLLQSCRETSPDDQHGTNFSDFNKPQMHQNNSLLLAHDGVEKAMATGGC